MSSVNEAAVDPAALSDQDEEMDILPPPGSVHDRFLHFVDAALHKAGAIAGDTDPMVIKLSLLLRKVAQLMSDDAHWTVHRPAGWTQASYRICFALWVSGPLPPNKVAQSTNMSRASISAGMKKIFEAGLITKEPSKDDLRSTVLKLTDKGKHAVESTYLAHLGLESNWFGPLTDVERRLLFMLLEKMLSGEEAAIADGWR
ncbi:MAG: MarR family transcriptional regulator [Pseudonocardiaceae bacterium]|nr:MarR family transcriptional regulator [Pseudonocardiaceae bacterium]